MPADISQLVMEWAALAGAISLPLVTVEPLLRDEYRTKIASWVRGAKFSKAVEPWPKIASSLMDRVFGDKHLSWKCFIRSAIASSFVVLLLFFVPRLPDFIDDPLLIYFLDETILIILIFAIFINFVPDYLSLLETRIIVHFLNRSDDGINFQSSIMWLAIDFLITTCIVYFGFCLFGIFLGLSGQYHVYGKKPFSNEWLQFTINGFFETIDILHTCFQYILGLNKDIGRERIYMPFIISTYLTSIWLWLYLVSGFVVRTAYRVERFQDFIDKTLKLDTHPLQVMALILVAVFSAIYWPVVLFT